MEDLTTRDAEEENFDSIYYGKMGMCGCGCPEGVKNTLYNLMKNHKDKYDGLISFEEMVKRRKEIICGDVDAVFEFIFHVLDKVGIVEHGGSIYGAWLTDEGREFLSLLEKFKDKD